MSESSAYARLRLRARFFSAVGVAVIFLAALAAVTASFWPIASALVFFVAGSVFGAVLFFDPCPACGESFFDRNHELGFLWAPGPWGALSLNPHCGHCGYPRSNR